MANSVLPMTFLFESEENSIKCQPLKIPKDKKTQRFISMLTSNNIKYPLKVSYFVVFNIDFKINIKRNCKSTNKPQPKWI